MIATGARPAVDGALASGPQRGRSGLRPASRAADTTSCPTCSINCPSAAFPRQAPLHEMMYAARRSDCDTARVRFTAERRPSTSRRWTLKAPTGSDFSSFDFLAEDWKNLPLPM